jgi:hypothetical protein
MKVWLWFNNDSEAELSPLDPNSNPNPITLRLLLLKWYPVADALSGVAIIQTAGLVYALGR